MEAEAKRKMQGSAYSGVKSKIARNVKVIDRVNRDHGYNNPHALSPKKRPLKKRQPGDVSFKMSDPIPVPSHRLNAVLVPGAATDEDLLLTF